MEAAKRGNAGGALNGNQADAGETPAVPGVVGSGLV